MKKAIKKVVKAQPATGTGNSWNIQEKAIKELERGLAQLHKQSYGEALTHFQAILDGYPLEKELLDRVKGYARICTGLLDEKKTTAQRRPEDMFYLGVMKANEARYDEAVEFLDRALQTAPRDEKVHYVMASTRALKGDRELALKHLQEAIELNATNRVYAQNDPDFEPIRGEDGFQNLIYPEEA
jgi:tetratricopeptide (TPR) repeat protein